ncbi:LytTR family transcriptional regulator [Paraflavitalea soli]|uniref:LytTR family transcriptional regulator n=1 Tax=Paraflavitalea soli TaxID=2315862 RepID=A0A3B7MPZ6_9BACT|nr:LytTR family transcriptional regulator [Paraflavitalea soli]
MLKPFFVYQNKILIRINPEELVCLVAEKNYTKLFLTHKRYYLVRSTLTGILKKLPPEMFIKVHRAYAVSIFFMDKVDRDQLEIGGQSVPISRRYYTSVIEQLNIIE